MSESAPEALLQPASGTIASRESSPTLLAEYRMARTAVAVVERTDQAQIRMWGRDPVKMLQGLITNDLAASPPGQGVYAGMLTPKGRMIAELRAFAVTREGAAELLIDLPREALAGTSDHLRRYVPPMFARWAVLESLRCVGVYGPRSPEVVSRVLGTEMRELAEDAFEETSFRENSVVVVGSRYAGDARGFDLFVSEAAVAELRQELEAAAETAGGGRINLETLDTLRIEAGRPRYGAELTEETIPTEAYESTGLMSRAISFGKGCYTGQEVIVRIAHRGHVNRHLRGVRLGANPAATGVALVRADGKEMGRTTSATYSPLLGESIALAYLRREVAPGHQVHLGDSDGPLVAVCELPFSPESQVTEHSRTAPGD